MRDALPLMRFTPAEAGGGKVRQLVQQPFIFSLSRGKYAGAWGGAWTTLIPNLELVPFIDLTIHFTGATAGGGRRASFQFWNECSSTTPKPLAQ